MLQQIVFLKEKKIMRNFYSLPARQTGGFYGVSCGHTYF
jgi:hypothetical protein